MIYFDNKEQCNKWEKNKLEAIAHLVDGDFSALGDVVTYNDGQTPPTDAEIEAEMTRLEAEFDASEYARNRVSEYPSIEECVHAILDNDNNELDTLQAKRAEIKLKYPKGG